MKWNMFGLLALFALRPLAAQDTLPDKTLDLQREETGRIAAEFLRRAVDSSIVFREKPETAQQVVARVRNDFPKIELAMRGKFQSAALPSIRGTLVVAKDTLHGSMIGTQVIVTDSLKRSSAFVNGRLQSK